MQAFFQKKFIRGRLWGAPVESRGIFARRAARRSCEDIVTTGLTKMESALQPTVSLLSFADHVFRDARGSAGCLGARTSRAFAKWALRNLAGVAGHAGP